MTNIFNLNVGFLGDGLSLFFLFTIFIISLPSAIYSLGYLKGHYSLRKIVYAWALLIVFVASMAMVVSADNALTFLIAWEIMSLISYFLVIFDNKNERSVLAGTIYAVMTHIGTAFITAAFLILYKHAGSFNFAVLKETCQSLPTVTKNLLFIFFLIGFGTKAGIVPLHIWLPYAHPQAPSHISSIMSGVMIKTAIYGLIRFVICIIGVDSLWWANAVLILAVVSSLVGVIYALMEQDLKKVLAYSSVENIGIMLLGVGLAMLFLKINLPVLAVFSLAASLYHLINHAIFKGLLFLCAGCVYKATGTRDMEKLGGLIKKMPQVSAYFLIGAMSISALPPFNGFVSEWLALQAFFLGVLSVTTGLKIFLSLCAASLAITSGLALSCFVKAFGAVFLAMPRSIKSQEANETEISLSMKAGMGFLSALCFVFGIASVWIFKTLAAVAKDTMGFNTLNTNFSLNNFTLLSGSTVFLSIPIITLVLALVVVFILILIYVLFGKNKVRRYNTWDCGYYKLTSRNEYSATAFSKPFRIAFSFFLQPYKKTEKIRESFYHVKTFKYSTFTTPVFKKYIYSPVLRLVFGSARGMRRLQAGSIHLYISYIFATILLLIIFMKQL